MTIVITAPTGNIGSKLVQQLLAEDAALTLIVRDPAKLSDDVRSRVTVKQGDLEDAEFIRTATQGADALFWLSPPNMTAPDADAYYAALTHSAVESVETNQIPRVVLISGGGGGRRDIGLASYAFATEDALNATGANVLSLRCGYFMENFLTAIPTLQNDGAWYGLFRPDLPVPFVATRDIAAVAAQKLLDNNRQGQSVQAVHGAADVTLAEAADILTEVLEKPIHYVQVPAEAVLQSLQGAGLSPDIARNMVTMFQGFDSGAYSAEPRTAETTTPTTLKEWAQTVLKPAMAGK